MERIGVHGFQKPLEDRISRTWWEADRMSSGRKVSSLDKLGRGWCKRRISRIGRKGDQVHCRYVQFETFTSFSWRESQGKFGYNISINKLLNKWRGLRSHESFVPSQRVSPVPLTLFFLLFRYGGVSCIRSGDVSTNIGPMLHTARNSHVWRPACYSWSLQLCQDFQAPIASRNLII